MSSLRERRIAKTQDLKRLRRLSSSSVNTNGDNKSSSDNEGTTRARAHSTLPTPQNSSNSLNFDRSDSVKVAPQSRHVSNRPPKYIFSDEPPSYNRDFEGFYLDFIKAKNEYPELETICAFPENDLTIVKRERTMKSLPPNIASVYEKLKEREFNQTVSTLSLYNENWFGISRSFISYGTKPKEEKELTLPTYETGPNAYMFEHEDNNESESGNKAKEKPVRVKSKVSVYSVDFNNSSVLEDELDVNEIPKKQKYNIMGDLYPLPDHPVIQEIPKLLPYQYSIRFIVKPIQLSFVLGNIEPYFLSMYLFDVVKKVRVSETFHFDMNSEETLELLSNYESKNSFKRDVLPLFSLTQPSQDIWLIIRIDKVLQGETHDQIAETYSKYEYYKDKDREKINDKVSSFCQKLGNFRQPFCWGCIAIFSDEKHLSVGKGISLTTLYRYKDNVGDQCIADTLNESSKNVLSNKKNRTIPGKLELDIIELKDDETYENKTIVDPDGVVVYPKDKVKTPEKDYIQEVAPLPRPFSPFLTYSNVLYIYPLELSLTKLSNAIVSPKNIAISVELCEQDNLNSAIDAIYNRNHSEKFTKKIFTNVNYHNKNPQFYDEIKIELPAKLSSKHNLIFTFYHIACANKGKIEAGTQIPVGYVILPLSYKGMIHEKVLKMNILSHIPKNYLSSNKEEVQKHVIDDKKAKFRILIRPESTLHPTGALHVLFSEYSKAISNPRNYQIEKLNNAITDLPNTPPLKLMQFLPNILNILLGIMCNFSNMAKLCFETIVTVIHLIYQKTDDHTSVTLQLSHYVDYLFVSEANATKLATATKINSNESVLTTLYFNLANAWLVKLKSKINEYEKLHKLAWFFFKLIYVSMASTALGITKSTFKDLKNTNKTTDGFNFPPEHLVTIRQLVLVLGWEVQERIKGSLTLSKELNKKIATFLCDILSVVDRGIVFSFITNVLKEIAPNVDEESYNLTLDFLRCITTHEHFMQMNLPVPLEIDSKNIGNLSELLLKRHFLSGLILRQIFSPIPMNNKSLRMKAIHLLETLLYKADNDSRLSDKKIRSQYIQMYFPFILYVTDNYELYQTRDFDERRCVYLCFLHIINSMDEKTLQQWWKVDTLSRIHNFLNILADSCEIFEFVGVGSLIKKLTSTNEKEDKLETLRLLEDYYSDTSNLENLSVKSIREKRLEAKRPKSSSTIPSLKNMIWKHAGIDSDKNKYITDEKRESNLSNEISFIILKMLCLFTETKRAELLEQQPNTLMDRYFSVVVSLLGRKQSIEVIIEGLKLLKHIIIHFSNHLFKMSTSYCGKIVQIIFKYCNFKDFSVRSYASAILFLLMRTNFELSNPNNRRFTRVKVQSIIALSGLIATSSGIKDTTYLTSALEATRNYASNYNGPDNKLLSQQVDQIVAKLSELLEDNVKIKEHEDDQEMKIDLFHRIAQSYKNAPDLRVTWLQSLANFHEEKKSWAEAAQTYIHIAALISEYLQIIEPTKGSIKGAAAFDVVSASAVEEQTILEGKNLLEEEGVFETNELFKEEGLVKAIEIAIKYLNQGQLYETAIELYKLLIPIYEKNRNHKKLSEAYQNLSKMHSDIIEVTRDKTRLFGSYYRVGFYGKKFGELNEKEYIYKEPRITRLGEIQEKLVNLYSKKLKTDIEILTQSNDVDKSKLDPNKCYIQLTSVTPYLEEWELKERLTDFDRNNNINRFIFVTPFTKNSKAQANNLDEQMRRKTILLVEKNFPYVKNRLEVIEKDIIELTPIQNALEIITDRTRALKRELDNPNLKSLQNVLQGSVRLQVHAGPQEICKTFLEKQNEYDIESVEKLKLAIQEFLDACGEALAKNKEMISSSQLNFHQELEEGLKEITAFVEPYLSSSY